ARTLADIAAMGGNDAADERRFATAARLSEINLNLYRTYVQPAMQALITPTVAGAIRALHPLRLQYELFSDANPMMAPIARLAEQAREQRRIAADGNPFVAVEKQAAEQIVTVLDAWRQLGESWCEGMFLAAFGAPALQAAVGTDLGENANLCKAV